MNLLTKLAEKFKNIKDETKKRIVTTVLAGSIALSGLGMAGCTSCIPDPNNTNPPITNPGDQNGGSNNGGSQNDYLNYSQILQNVLTDSYYYELISLDKSYFETNKEYLHYKNAKYNAIPYGFLEDEGFDINAIKNNKVASQSDMYLDGNDLFIELKIETKVGYTFSNSKETSYFTNYILKYNLTDQEVKEIKAMFKRLDVSIEKTTYFQSAFFVQELSYQKEPTVISKTYATEKGLQSFATHADKANYLTTNRITATYMGHSLIQDQIYNNTFQIHPSIDDKYNSFSQGNMTVARITVYGLGSGCATLNGLKIYANTHVDANFTNDELLKNLEASKKTVTYLTCQNAHFKDVEAKSSTLEELLK